MSWTDYGIKYLADPSGAVAGINRLIPLLKDLDALIVKTERGLKRLGATDNTGKMQAGLSGLNAKLAATAADGVAAGAALKGVGAGTTKITSTATKVAKLTANMNAAAASAGTLKAGLAGVGAGLGGAAPPAKRLGDNLGRIVGMAAGLGAMRKVVGALGDAIREAREKSEARGEESLGMREKTIELQQLLGISSDAAMAKTLKQAAAAGQTPEEAGDFLTKFHSSISSGVKAGHVPEAALGGIAEDAALLGAGYGMKSGTSADVAAGIINNVDLTKQRDAKGNLMSPRDAFKAQFAGVGQALSNEGRGNTDTLARNFVATMSTALDSGRLQDPLSAASEIGTTSIFAKTAASTATGAAQASALVNNQKAGTARKPGPAAWLKKVGIADQVGDEAKFKKLHEVLAAEAAAFKGPGKFDANTFLAQQGFGQERQRLMAIARAGREDFAESIRADAQATARDPSRADAVMTTFKATKEFHNRQADANTKGAVFLQGREQEDAIIARKNAMTRMLNRGELDDQDSLMMDALKGGFGLKEWMGFTSAQRDRVENEVNVEMKAKAKAVGITPVGQRKVDTSDYFTKERKTTAEKNAILMKDMRAIGVDPHAGESDAGLGAKLDELEAAPRPPVKAGIAPGGAAGAAGGRGAAGANGAAGPQASIGGDLKPSLEKLIGLTAETNKILAASVGGGSVGGGRRQRDYGPPPDFSGPSGPYRPGSAV